MAISTTAQDAFNAFLDKQLQDTYNFDSLTAEQRQQEMEEYTRLKIASQKEQKSNEQEYQQKSLLEQQQQLDNFTNKIINEGFSGSYNLNDYKLLLIDKKDFIGDDTNKKACDYYDNAKDKQQEFIRLYNLYSK